MIGEDTFTIPKSRIGAVIGPKGQVLKELRQKSGCEITIDSETGEVTIIAPNTLEDPMTFIRVRDIVRAIARGFTPEKAMKLLSDDYFLELISLRDLGIKTEKAAQRVRSRVIGRDGKSRYIIEQSTGVFLSVMGNTIGILGQFEALEIAKEAVMRLIEGETHGTVFHFLEMKRREINERKYQLYQEADPDEDPEFKWDADI